MSLSSPRIIFGIHSITPFRRSDSKPYGIMKVIGSAALALTAETEKLFAGSNKFAWAAEAKTINSELSVKLKEYPNFLFELFLGATVTDNTADASGTVENFVNVKGSTVKGASNGLSAITVSTAANLKHGKYVLIATGAGTADLFLVTDIDALRGVDLTYVDDLLKVGTIDISSATEDLGTTIGLSFTKAGTPAFTTGDSAEFYVRPPSTDSMEVKIGASSTTFSAFGAYCVAQKRADGSIFDMEIYNAIANGMPVSLEENAFSQPEIKLDCLYDSSKDAICKMKHYIPS